MRVKQTTGSWGSRLIASLQQLEQILLEISHDIEQLQIKQ